MTSLDHIHTWVGIWNLGCDQELLMCVECGEQRAISSLIGDTDVEPKHYWVNDAAGDQ